MQESLVDLYQLIITPYEERFDRSNIYFVLIDSLTFLTKMFPTSAAVSFCLLSWTIVNLYDFLVDDVKAFIKDGQSNLAILENQIHIDKWRRHHFLLRQLSNKLTQCFDVLLLICIVYWFIGMVTVTYTILSPQKEIFKIRDTLFVTQMIFNLAIINLIPTKIQQQV